MKKMFFVLIIFVLFLNALSIASISPRLLIYCNSSDIVSINELVEKRDALIIDLELYTTHQQVEDVINKLDLVSDNHLIILYGNIEKFRTFAMSSSIDVMYYVSNSVGYDYITIQNIKDAQVDELINKKIQEMPTSDEILPRIKKQTAGELYALMMQVDEIFSHENILYWATSGTLLGVIRHRGLIPWDDDLDIAIRTSDIAKLENLRDLLKEKGLELYSDIHGYYKIFPLNGKQYVNCYKIYEGEFLPWRFPFVDIIPMHIHENDTVLRYKADVWRNRLKNDYYYPHEIQEPLLRMKFGPMEIPVPHDPLRIIRRFYGKDWNDICYVEWDHMNEKRVRKIKVALSDRSEVPFELPKSDA